MLWRLWFGDRLEEAGARARRLHSLWLSRALRRGSRPVPRIPTKLVSEGGFAATMATEEGRRWAEQWWDDALRPPEDRDQDP